MSTGLESSVAFCELTLQKEMNEIMQLEANFHSPLEEEDIRAYRSREGGPRDRGIIVAKCRHGNQEKIAGYFLYHLKGPAVEIPAYAIAPWARGHHVERQMLDYAKQKFLGPGRSHLLVRLRDAVGEDVARLKETGFEPVSMQDADCVMRYTRVIPREAGTDPYLRQLGRREYLRQNLLELEQQTGLTWQLMAMSDDGALATAAFEEVQENDGRHYCLRTKQRVANGQEAERELNRILGLPPRESENSEPRFSGYLVLSEETLDLHRMRTGILRMTRMLFNAVDERKYDKPVTVHDASPQIFCQHLPWLVNAAEPGVGPRHHHKGFWIPMPKETLVAETREETRRFRYLQAKVDSASRALMVYEELPEGAHIAGMVIEPHIASPVRERIGRALVQAVVERERERCWDQPDSEREVSISVRQRDVPLLKTLRELGFDTTGEQPGRFGEAGDGYGLRLVLHRPAHVTRYERMRHAQSQLEEATNCKWHLGAIAAQGGFIPEEELDNPETGDHHYVLRTARKIPHPEAAMQALRQFLEMPGADNPAPPAEAPPAYLTLSEKELKPGLTSRKLETDSTQAAQWQWEAVRRAFADVAGYSGQRVELGR